jgi:hypothetical protein
VYVSGKMIPVETVPGVRGGENDGGDEFNSDKIFCKCHNVPPV